MARKPLSAEDQAAVIALGDLLFDRFPRAFVHPRLKGKGMRPLKVGIDKDIKAALPDVPKRVIKAFLNRYTGSLHYRRCGTMVGTWRVDLEGNAVAVISPDHARNSELHLKRMRAARETQPSTEVCEATGKRLHPSPSDAAAEGRAAIARTGGQPSMAKGYRCEFCGSFHWANRLPPTEQLR